jgi:deoxyuridine 5'-triphosphate nucleotidohydrolase
MIYVMEHLFTQESVFDSIITTGYGHSDLSTNEWEKSPFFTVEIPASTSSGFIIDSVDKAYLIGLVSNSRIESNSILPDLHYSMYKKFNSLVKPYSVNNVNSKSPCFTPLVELFESFKKNIIHDKLPEVSQQLLEFYIRGMYERNNPAFKNVVLRHESKSVLEDVLDKCNIKGVITKGKVNFILTFTGSNKLDFLHYIYKSKGKRSWQHYKRYLELCNPGGGDYKHLQLRYSLNSDLAVPPSKERASDSGYDMTLLYELKRSGNVIFYDTGVSVQPPDGFYFDLIGRSSISKSGYILANNMGVIDRSYTGNIIVALIKIDNGAPDLTLPNRLVQIIPRRIVHMEPVLVENLESTNRADKGFGSSNKYGKMQIQL